MSTFYETGYTVSVPETDIWLQQTNSSSRQWQSIASSSDGTKLVTCVSGGYIYISSDSGETWTPRDSPRKWISVASSSNGEKLVACDTDGNIYTSINSGESWTQRTSIGAFRVASSSDGVKLVASQALGYIYTSQNSGQSWTTNSNSSGNNIWSGLASSSDGEKLVASSWNYIYTSSNSGGTWTTNGNSSGEKIWSGVASSSDGTKLVACSSATGIYGSSSEYIYTSSNSGGTWTTNGNSSGSRVWTSVACSSDGTKIVACASPGYIYISNDFGISWSNNSNSSVSRNWSSVASSSDGTKLVACVDGGYIYTSSRNQDIGYLLRSPTPTSLYETGYVTSGINNTWSESNSPSKDWFKCASSSNGKYLVACVINEYIYTSNDYGDTWITRTKDSVNNDLIGEWTSVATSSDGNYMFACSYYGYIYYSNNYGDTWSRSSNNIGVGQWSSIASSSNGKYVTACNINGYLYNSINYGVTFTLILTVNNAVFRSVSLSSDGKKRVACMYGYFSNGIYTSSGSIWISSNYGVSWQEVQGITKNNYWICVASSSDGTILVACVDGGSIWRSIDSGVTWTTDNTSGNKSWKGVAISSNGKYVYAITKTENSNTGYIYNSTNYGNTWSETDAPIKIWFGIALSSNGQNVIAVSSNNTKIYRYSTDMDIGNMAGAMVGSYTTGYNVKGRNTLLVSNSPSKIWGVCASSSNGKYVVAGAYLDYIYTSTDYGVNWTVHTKDDDNGDLSGNWTGIASSSDGQYLVASIYNGLIYTSNDYGYTWIKRDSIRSWYEVTSSSSGKYLAAVVEVGKIYTSTDYGVNWTIITNNSTSLRWRSIASSSSGQYLVAGDYGSPGKITEILPGDEGGYIWTSDNSGNTWTQRTNSGSRHWITVASSSSGQYLAAGVYNGGDSSSDLSGSIYTSSDYGDTWIKRTAAGKGRWLKIVLSSNGKYIFACAIEDYIWKSDDYGVTWSKIDNTARVWYNISISNSGQYLTACDGNGKIYTYSIDMDLGDIIGSDTQ